MEALVVCAQVVADGDGYLAVEHDGRRCAVRRLREPSGGPGRREVPVRDLPAGDRRVVLVWQGDLALS